MRPYGKRAGTLLGLGSGADIDGRCNQVNQGESCSWNYGDATCCKIAIDDGFPGNVHCP
jgi:hypothetical protein